LSLLLAIVGCRGDAPPDVPREAATPPTSQLTEAATRAIEAGQLSLPVATGKGRPFTSTAAEVMVSSASIALDGQVVADIVDGAVADEQLEGGRIAPLFDALEEKRAAEKSAGGAPLPWLLLVADAGTPWSVFEQVAQTAGNARWKDLFLLAVEEDGTRVTIPLRAYAGGEETWMVDCDADVLCLTVVLGEGGTWIDAGEPRAVMEERPPPSLAALLQSPPRWPRSADGTWPVAELDTELRRFESEFPEHEGVHVHAVGGMALGQVTPSLSILSHQGPYDERGLRPALVGASLRLTVTPEELDRRWERRRELLSPLMKDALGGAPDKGETPGPPSP